MHFLVNGVEVAVGSTALLLAGDNKLNVNTLDGSVDITSAGETRTVEPGYRVTATENTPPSEPEPYPYEDVRSAPINLLPETIGVPVILEIQANDGWTNTGISLSTGQTYSILAEGTVASCAGSDCPTYFARVVSADGIPGDVCGDCRLAGVPEMALIGRVGNNEAFLVGTEETFVSEQDDFLWLAVNGPYVHSLDHIGSFNVIITME